MSMFKIKIEEDFLEKLGRLGTLLLSGFMLVWLLWKAHTVKIDFTEAGILTLVTTTMFTSFSKSTMRFFVAGLWLGVACIFLISLMWSTSSIGFMFFSLMLGIFSKLGYEIDHETGEITKKM